MTKKPAVIVAIYAVKGVLEETFDYIVVDLGVAMSEVALSVLERADRILLIVTPELPTLKDTADLLRIFDDMLEIPHARVSLVLNHSRPQTMVTRADAERVVKRKMEMAIAYEGARFDRAAVTGQILVAAEPSSAAAKSVMRLAGLVTDEHKKRTAKRARDAG
jgi:Flp pilus assembly CpaE family ATPase